MKCKNCGHPEAKHEPILLPPDAFTKCPVCQYEAKDYDDLLNHVEQSCRKGLDYLAKEIMLNPRRVCEKFEP